MNFFSLSRRAVDSAQKEHAAAVAALGIDRVRPFSAGPRPVLGVQSAKPAGWSAFQGVQLCNLDDLLEQSLWNDGRDGRRTGARKEWSAFANQG